MVILKVPKGSEYLDYIKFRYGKEEYIPPETVGITCTIGFILALPNIILYIVKKYQKKNDGIKMYFSYEYNVKFCLWKFVRIFI
jgi:hypothetical protein